jgi:hypothetical protein
MNGDLDSNACIHNAVSSFVLWHCHCFYVGRDWRFISCLGDVPTKKWMGTMSASQNFIEQMVLDISLQAFRLDSIRLRLFLEWLNAHTSQINIATPAAHHPQQPSQMIAIVDENLEERFTNSLRTWFSSLSMQGSLWEYHLILDEIIWWRELDAQRLKMLSTPEARD